MSELSHSVSLHPYFEVEEARVGDFVATMERFVERTRGETARLYYDFTRDGRRVFCREAYVDAAGVLAHLENVGDLLEEVLGYSKLLRLEVHGPAAELDKLRGPLADLKPDFFVREAGIAD